jgi:hypothetical protein
MTASSKNSLAISFCLLIREHGGLTRGFVWLSQDLSDKVLLNAVKGGRRRAPFMFCSTSSPLPTMRWVNLCFRIQAADAPAGRLASEQGDVRHRRLPPAVHAVRQERVGDARVHGRVPADAQVGRAQRLLQEISVGSVLQSSENPESSAPSSPLNRLLRSDQFGVAVPRLCSG